MQIKKKSSNLFTIIPAHYSELSLICWNRNLNVPIDIETAHSLYERNVRFIDFDKMSNEERSLYDRLFEI